MVIISIRCTTLICVYINVQCFFVRVDRWKMGRRKPTLIEKTSRTSFACVFSVLARATQHHAELHQLQIIFQLIAIYKETKETLSLSMADRVSGVFHNCEKVEKQRANNISGSQILTDSKFNQR